MSDKPSQRHTPCSWHQPSSSASTPFQFKSRQYSLPERTWVVRAEQRKERGHCSEKDQKKRNVRETLEKSQKRVKIWTFSYLITKILKKRTKSQINFRNKSRKNFNIWTSFLTKWTKFWKQWTKSEPKWNLLSAKIFPTYRVIPGQIGWTLRSRIYTTAWLLRTKPYCLPEVSESVLQKNTQQLDFWEPDSVCLPEVSKDVLLKRLGIRSEKEKRQRQRQRRWQIASSWPWCKKTVSHTAARSQQTERHHCSKYDTKTPGLLLYRNQKGASNANLSDWRRISRSPAMVDGRHNSHVQSMHVCAPSVDHTHTTPKTPRSYRQCRPQEFDWPLTEWMLLMTILCCVREGCACWNTLNPALHFLPRACIVLFLRIFCVVVLSRLCRACDCTCLATDRTLKLGTSWYVRTWRWCLTDGFLLRN